MTGPTDLEAIREYFPIFRHRTYLDTACYAPGYRRAAEAVHDWWTSAQHFSGTTFDQTLAWLRPIASARAEAAKLLNADEAEIGFITSTALGMNRIANAMPMGANDNIVINDLEFAGNTVPFAGQRRRGVELRRVHHREGRLDLEDFERLVDGNTKLIAVSSVQWTTGLRMNLEALADLADANGAYLVVDSCQSLGALELDVRKSRVHFMATQAHKWLFGPFGTGLIYCRSDVIGKLDPVDVETGNLLKDPARQPYHHLHDLDNVADYDHGFAPTAARLQTCSNLPGLWGLEASLKCINGIGIKVIEKRIQGLVEHLLGRLSTLARISVVSPMEPEARSAIVVITTGDVAGDLALMAELNQLGVGVSVRYQAGQGGIRVSCHVYNNEDDIEKLISAIAGDTKPLYFH